ncbi:hypothetical protein Tco_0700549 [Tanacetum coccineum]
MYSPDRPPKQAWTKEGHVPASDSRNKYNNVKSSGITLFARGAPTSYYNLFHVHFQSRTSSKLNRGLLPRDSAKPSLGCWVSLGISDSLVRYSSELAVRRGEGPKERSVVPGRHAASLRAVEQHEQSADSDGFEPGDPRASPQSQSFSRGLRIHFADVPCPTLFIDQRLSLGGLMRLWYDRAWGGTRSFRIFKGRAGAHRHADVRCSFQPLDPTSD